MLLLRLMSLFHGKGLAPVFQFGSAALLLHLTAPKLVALGKNPLFLLTNVKPAIQCLCQRQLFGTKPEKTS
ncbi:hypothetical protein C9993_08935 [Marinobacter sp. Z-F4-2]|nr:hypothetical protein C9993_08935 [Marinobacter sp. Z-F4-2]